MENERIENMKNFNLVLFLTLLLSLNVSMAFSENSPIPGIKVNNSDGPISLSTDNPISLTVSMEREGVSENADWWLGVNSPFGLLYLDIYTGLWNEGFSYSYQGPLFNFSPVEILNLPSLPPGTYIFYFGVDLNMNGQLDIDPLYFDQAVVNVQSPGDMTGNIIGAITIDDNLVVERNTILTLNGTTINGNVFVRSGARLYTYGANILGNIQAQDAMLVELKQQTSVDGDVQGEGTQSMRVLENSRVEGNIQIKEANASADQYVLFVDSSRVNGDVQAEKSSGRLQVKNSRINGNLQFVENYTGPYMITKNVIDGDLQFFKNKGEGAITDNRVGGNLQSKENTPQPTVKNNSVDGDTEIE